MILQSYLTYVWVFFAFVALIYSLLLFSDNDRIIPDSFKKNRNHSFYDVWRSFTASFWLFIAAGFVLLTFADNNFNKDNTAPYFTYLSIGIVSLVIGFVAMYFLNKKALHLFDPNFYVRNNLVKKTKEEKAEEKLKKKAAKERQRAYIEDMKARQKAFEEKEGK